MTDSQKRWDATCNLISLLLLLNIKLPPEFNLTSYSLDKSIADYVWRMEYTIPVREF